MPFVLLIATFMPHAAASPLTTLGEDGSAGPAAHGPPPALPVTSGDPVADPMDWPEVAGIVIDRYVSCTGTLIAPDVVITAGHCTPPESHNPTAVVLGTNNYDHPGETINVAEVHTYPNSWGTYDVAVLVLEHASSYEPRRIATSCIRDYIRDGAEATVVGYGATDANGRVYSSVLQWGNTTISDADCSDLNSGCFEAVSPNGEIGAGISGSDACYGDSGGPLFLPTPKGIFLVGVTSRGFYDTSVACGDGGIWVRPDSPDLHDWIEEVTGRTLPAPACFEPTAPALYAVKNHPGHSQVDPNYDEGEPFTFEIVTPPAFGGASVSDDGLVTFTPETGFEGEDTVTVSAIAHDGSAAEIDIPIKIVSRPTYRQMTGESVPGGCNTTGVEFAGVGLLVALASVRRRSAAAARTT